jgi:hypothetical protein
MRMWFILTFNMIKVKPQGLFFSICDTRISWRLKVHDI